MRPDNRHLVSWLLCLMLLWAVPSLAQPRDWVYVARPGETLPEVAERFLAPTVPWHKLAIYNNLQRNAPLKAGQKLNIPLDWLQRQPAPAHADKVSGEVWIRPNGQTRLLKLAPGQALGVGDEVRVGAGRAEIRFADGSRLTLAPNSVVIFNALTRYANTGMVDTRLRLNKGHSRNQVNPLHSPGGRYEISTPNAIAAVRGTDFRLAYTGNATHLAVEEGTVELSASGVRHQVPAGHGMSVAQGEASTFTLLPAPAGQVPDVFDSLPITLKWAAVSGARAYRVIVLADDDMGTLHFSARVRVTEARIDDLPNGRYIAEIRALDARDIEGLPLRLVFEVRRKAAPANLVAPQTSSRVMDSVPRFIWQVPKSGLLASVEVARDPDFREVVATTPFSLDNEAELPDLPAGHYYWRVVTLAGEDEVALSDVRDLEVVRALPQPRIIAVNYFDDTVKLFWRRIDGATHYVLELAKDELFRHVVRADTLKQPWASIRLPRNERFYARVRAEGSTFTQPAVSDPVVLSVPPAAS